MPKDSPSSAQGPRSDPRGPAARGPLRADLARIAEWIEPGARVLDIGCGSGELLDHLVHGKGVDGRGLELSMDGVRASVAQGLPVIQGDADTDLKDYPAGSFDYVILSQTLQAMKRPKDALDHLVRIGRHAVVSVPNFGHWRARLHLLLKGRMPVTEALGWQWWETPNIHLCTIADFQALCRESGIVIERSVILDSGGRPVGPLMANLLGEQALFLLKRV